jgi:hypothetical protein
VHKVKHKVVLHSNIEGLHLLSGVTQTTDGSVDGVGGLHKVVVFVVDFLDNACSVDSFFVTGPVNCLELLGGTVVEEVKDRLKLAVSLLGLTSVGSCIQGAKPVVGKLVVAGTEGPSRAAHDLSSKSLSHHK